jgi:hypothetical protein
LYKSESPSPKDALCQVWLKLAQWLWRRRFLNAPTYFFHFCDCLPFKKDLALDLYNFKFPLPKDDWRAGSGEDFYKFSVNFYYFAIISP